MEVELESGRLAVPHAANMSAPATTMTAVRQLRLQLDATDTPE